MLSKANQQVGRVFSDENSRLLEAVLTEMQLALNPSSVWRDTQITLDSADCYLRFSWISVFEVSLQLRRGG